MRDDMQVRVAVVNWVTTLRKDDPEHMTFTLALLRKLMEAHLKLCRTGKARSYSNSLQHRQGHRLVAAILVLEPIIPEVSGELSLSFARLSNKTMSYCPGQHPCCLSDLSGLVLSIPRTQKV